MNYNYNVSSTKFLKDRMQGNMEAIYQPFLERIPKKGIILDAGCGSGRDSLYFKKIGHLVIPMDTSEQICELAGEAIGQAVLFCRFQDVHFKLPFNGVWACGSLIHLESSELVHVLRHLYWYLRQGGTLYTAFHYGSFEGQREGEFYLDLEEQKATKIFTEAGYEIEKMWITGQEIRSGVNRKWLNILARKRA